MKAKGQDSDSADKICGKLQSETKGANELTEALLSGAISRDECVKKAKNMGHNDPDEIKRICDAVPTKGKKKGSSVSPEDPLFDDGTQPDNEGAEEQETNLTNPGSGGDITAPSGMSVPMSADTFEQDKGYPLPWEHPSGTIDPEFTGINKDDIGSGGPTFDDADVDEPSTQDDPEEYELDNVGLDDNEHIANQEDGQAAMGDNLIDMDMDDSNIDVEQLLSNIDRLLGGAVSQNQCIQEALHKGLSVHEAHKKCIPDKDNTQMDLKYGDPGAEFKSQYSSNLQLQNQPDYVEGSDTGSHTASYDENDIKLLEAFFTREKENQIVDNPSQLGRDTTNGGKDLEGTGRYVTGHGPNSLKADPHKHDMGNDGPTYDHFGNAVINDADTIAPDVYTTDHNSNLEDNDHITTHMSSEQKQMGEQNLEQVPQEDDNESMQGLGMDSVGNIVKKGPTKESESIKQAWNESVAKEAIDATKKLNKISQILSANVVTEVAPKETVNWIKNGTTYSGSQCVQDFGGDNDAKDVCQYIVNHYSGSYDAYMAAMQIEPFEQNNKLFVKAFLMDPSLNLNKWGVSPTTLDANIRSYIGKPLVLQDNFDHPVSADDNLQHQLEYQELFRVGNIVDIVNKNGKYDAIAEITDPYAQKAFKEGNLPLYVSPQLYKLDANEADGQMTKWTGTHLAIVKEPAYTVKRATINGECTGEHDTCMTYLKKAAIIKEHGYGNCGYCNYKVLSSARPQKNAVVEPQMTLTPVITTAATGTTGFTTVVPVSAATHPEKDLKINHAPWIKSEHSKEVNEEYEKSLQATLEEDRLFIEDMEKFLNN